MKGIPVRALLVFLFSRKLKILGHLDRGHLVSTHMKRRLQNLLNEEQTLGTQILIDVNYRWNSQNTLPT